MADSGQTCTFQEAKDYLMSTVDQSKTGKGKIPNGAQHNVWMTLMPAPSDDFNEVYPNIILGGYKIAKDPEQLKGTGVTHVVNCAMGKKFNQIDTDSEFFEESCIKFHGFVASDIMTFKIAPHFDAAVDFIENAMETGGKLYIHCMSGVSRSATIVLAFLMMKRNMHLMEALKLIRQKRNILPNDGFLKQLVELNNKLYGGSGGST